MRAGVIAALLVGLGCDAAPAGPRDDALALLGRHLFYDARLSVDETTSCASCHRQELGFADDTEVSVGATGERGVRNTPGLANVASLSPLTWAAPNLVSLEVQIQVPMFGELPVELGMSGTEVEIFARLRADQQYQELFARAFPGDPDPFDAGRALVALAAFCRTIESRNAPYDRYLAGDDDALDQAQKRGLALFESDRLGCARCHTGPDSTVADGSGRPTGELYYNIGLYDLDGSGAYPPGGEGLYVTTFDDGDRGKMRVPSLRNVAVSGPYMHDGSVATLDAVLDVFAAGGRVIADGPWAGDGRANPNKTELVRGFELSASERADLLRFFDALTDDVLLADPRLASPW